MDFDLTATGHVQVRVDLGELNCGVEVVGFEDAVAGHFTLAGRRAAVGGHSDSVGQRRAEVHQAIAHLGTPCIPLPHDGCHVIR
ncbi:hypothetical protein StoSoilB13_34080 (plasmid) [Arthrobacter sp. StoSoilB13]|nr:hypothetical protein StoSoilB13_34080 [Arthrobacter sp. StoSoilB13]